MKERILIGKELEIRFRLQGSVDADILCDLTRPLGSFLTEFEHDLDGDWNLLGLPPLREALHSNRWKQPALKQADSDFLREKFNSGDPIRMYVAFHIWNDYLIAREPRDREAVCQRFMDKMSGFTMFFLKKVRLNLTVTLESQSSSISPTEYWALFRLKKHGLTSGIRTTSA